MAIGDQRPIKSNCANNAGGTTGNQTDSRTPVERFIFCFHGSQYGSRSREPLRTQSQGARNCVTNRRLTWESGVFRD